MAIKTNKSKTKTKALVMDASTPVKPKERPPSWEVRPIDNGFIIHKSWTDKNGDYQREEMFSPENPLEVIFKSK